MSFAFFSIYFVIGCLVMVYLRSIHASKWWIELVTRTPECVYYFGPFDSQLEARSHQSGYIEDLQAEGAQISSIQIQRSQPKQLTIFNNPQSPA